MELKARIPAGPIEQKWDKHRFEMKLVNPANKRKYTVLVVGSGLAGASAAAQPTDPGGATHTRPSRKHTASATPAPRRSGSPRA